MRKSNERREDYGADGISLKEAALVFRELTGCEVSQRTIYDELYQRRHLGYFKYTPGGCEQLTTVRRGRWEYFIKARKLIYGPENIFHSNFGVWLDE